MWYFYILLCEDKSLYTGFTDKPQRRLTEHKNGKGGYYTSIHKPVKIIYREEFPTKNEALKREKQIKGWSR